MRHGYIFILVATLFCASAIFPNPASCQTSVGYTTAEDISNLLEYRLPDWSYRTWDAYLNLNGSGMERRRSGNQDMNNQFSTDMRTNYQQTWESEQRKLNLYGSLSGSYAHYHSGDETSESNRNRLLGEYTFSGNWEQHLSEGPFSLLLSGRTSQRYTEDIRNYRIGDIWDETRNFERRSTHSAYTGFGYGRQRNVVPLLRAQRLSERLVALGRAPLTTIQIQDLAQVFAKEFGYRQVFDRADRHFWEDILTPLLDKNNPLNPYEIFYLADTLNENLGDRIEGFQISAGFAFRENNAPDPWRDRITNRQRTPEVNLSWFHNLSLTQQIMIDGAYAYGWVNYESNADEIGILDFTLGHLWNVSDRINLETRLNSHTLSHIKSEFRQQQIRLGTDLNFFVEDQLSLNLGVTGNYKWEKIQTEEDIHWTWTYRLGIRYHLDRTFL